MLNHKYFLAISLTLIAVLGACKKTDSTSDDGKATVTFKITQVATSTASVSEPFVLDANDNSKYFAINDAQTGGNLYVWPTKLKYYISNIRLQDHDGKIVPAPNSTFLVVWDNTTSTQHFSLGKMIPAHYHYILFDIGVDSVNNHSDPTTQPNTSPLSLLYKGSSDMYWDWNSGYRFFIMEGKADTTGGHNDWSKSLTYHLGNDALRTTITLPVSIEAQPTTNDTVSVLVNNSKLLAGVNVRTEKYTETNDNLPLAQKIAANLQPAFTVGF